MGNFSPVAELRFRPDYCSHGEFQLGYRDEQGATLEVSSRKPDWSVHMGKFPDVGRKNRDLGNRASPPSHVNTMKFLQRKEWRGEIFRVDRAHMYRP